MLLCLLCFKVQGLQSICCIDFDRRHIFFYGWDNWSPTAKWIKGKSLSKHFRLTCGIDSWVILSLCYCHRFGVECCWICKLLHYHFEWCYQWMAGASYRRHGDFWKMASIYIFSWGLVPNLDHGQDSLLGSSWLDRELRLVCHLYHNCDCCWCPSWQLHRFSSRFERWLGNFACKTRSSIENYVQLSSRVPWPHPLEQILWRLVCWQRARIHRAFETKISKWVVQGGTRLSRQLLQHENGIQVELFLEANGLQVLHLHWLHGSGIRNLPRAMLNLITVLHLGLLMWQESLQQKRLVVLAELWGHRAEC